MFECFPILTKVLIVHREKNTSEKKAMYYNKSEIRRFKTENITEKAHESQDLLNVLMASASATMTCSI